MRDPAPSRRFASWRRIGAFLPLLVAASAPDLAAQAALRNHFGVASGARFGWSVAGVGDIDNDGFPDYAVGAPSEKTPLTTGAVFVYSGRTGDVLFLPVGTTSLENFGHAVAAAGDVNLDGFCDFVVGTPFVDLGGIDTGRAEVISGATGLRLFAVTGGNTSKLGFAVAGGADLDGDGVPDLVAGAPGADTAGTDSGEVQVVSGAFGTVVQVVPGTFFGDEFGTSVAVVGDVDGDGFADYAAGAPKDDDNGPSSGSVTVLRGLNGATLRLVAGDAAGDQLGTSVASAGDVDGDGRADFVAGAPFDDDHGPSSGSMRLYSGATGTALFTRFGDAQGDRLGTSVAGGGDLDGDGVPDLVAGIPFDDDTGADAGSARAFSGVNGQVLYTLFGDAAGDHFGWSVGVAGDVNGDGVHEALVGAPDTFNPGGQQAGEAELITDACGPTTPFGAGCDGGSGLVPQLGVQGCAAGGGTLTLSFSSGPPTGLAFLVVGTQAGNVPLGGGCALLVGPVPGFLGPLGPIPLDGSGTAVLEAVVPVPMPSGTVTLQALLPVATPTGLATSRGVSIFFP